MIASTESSSVDYSTSDAASTLLIKDCQPWETRANEIVLDGLGEAFDTIGSRAVNDIDLSRYETVIIPSSQTVTYYDRLAAESTTFDSFVSEGGTLVAHVTDSGWPCSTQAAMSFLPRGVGKRNATADYLDRADSDHPVFDGLSDNALDNWDSSTHGYLTDLPDDATVAVGINGDRSRATYAEYEHGSGKVLATMQTLEWPWNSGSGTKEVLRNELEYAVSGGESNSVFASATTLQFIPGKDENPSKDGHPLDSGLMQIFPPGLQFSVPGTDLELGALPILDSWMGGDMTDELPTSLEAAREPEAGKYADDVGDEAFNHYRIENGVRVAFETTDDGGVDQETVEIEFTDAGPSGADPIISRGEQQNSKTVLHRSDWNTIPWEEWYGENVRPSNRHPRYYQYDTEFEFDGVEGVRVLTILGGWAGFMGDVSRRAATDPVEFFKTIWEWDITDDLEAQLAMLAAPDLAQFAIDFLTTVPNTFTFIDFVVLADGRRFVRIWDASQYPSLSIYVDEERRELEKMSYDPRELVNLPMTGFMLDAAAGTTPYTAPGPLYKQILNSSDLLEELIGEYKKHTVNVLRDPVDIEDLLRPMPRKTLEISPDGELVTNPDDPFGSAADLPIPLSGTLNSRPRSQVQ